jgi:dihydropteroate synthase
MSRPLVMGVLNVTPDSFSDGGRYLDPDRAVERGLEMLGEGADVIDVGGESSRPGARPVPEEQELSRVVPVVESLASRVRVSVDTTKPAVAEAAMSAGATLLNDISASLWPMLAGTKVGWVAMHMKGAPPTMQDDPRYDDVVGEVRGFLVERAERAAEAGVQEIWVDPGIGFGKSDAHNLTLLRHLGTLAASGFPLLVGTSRKGFLGRLAGSAGEPLPVEDRLPGSLATATWAMLAGASMVRVHDVAATVQAASLVGTTRLDPQPPVHGDLESSDLAHRAQVGTAQVGTR